MQMRPLRHSFAPYNISRTILNNYFGAVNEKRGVTLGNNTLAQSKTVIDNLKAFLLPEQHVGRSQYLSATDCCSIAHSTTPVCTALMCVRFVRPDGEPTAPVVTIMNAGVTNPSTVAFTDYPQQVSDAFQLHSSKHDKGHFGMFSAVAGTRDMTPDDFPSLGASNAVDDDNLDDSIFLSPFFQEVFTPMGLGIPSSATDTPQDPHHLLTDTYTTDPASTVHALPDGFKLVAPPAADEGLKGFVFSRKVFPFPTGTSLPPGIILDPTDPDFGIQQLKQACVEVTSLPDVTWDWLDHIPSIDYWLQAAQANTEEMAIDLLPLSACSAETKSQLFDEEDSHPTFREVHCQLSHMLYRDQCIITVPSYTRFAKWEKCALEVTTGGTKPLETATHPALTPTVTYFCYNDAWDKDSSLGLSQYRTAAEQYVPRKWLNFNTFEVKATADKPPISELQPKHKQQATPTSAQASNKDAAGTSTTALAAGAWSALLTRETPPCASPPHKRVRIQPQPTGMLPKNLQEADVANAKGDDDSVIECFTAPSEPVRAGATNLHGTQDHSGVKTSPYAIPCEQEGFRDAAKTRLWFNLPVPKYHGTAKFNTDAAIDNKLAPYITDAAHLGSYRAPSTLPIVRKSDHKPIHELDFNFPGVLGNQYITGCLNAQTDKAAVKWLQRLYQYRQSNNPTEHLRVIPDIHSSFWSNHQLPSALKSGTIQSGYADICQEADLNQGISIWTMLGTVGPCNGLFKVPIKGLLCNDIIKVISNFYWFHALRYTDDSTFPQLPTEKSPFPQFGILSGHFRFLLTWLETTNIRQRWDDHHHNQPEHHQALTACLLVLVSKLIDIFLQWAASNPSTKYEPVLHPQETRRRDIVVIAERFGPNANSSLPKSCQDWRALIESFVENLEDAGRNPARYLQSTKVESFLLASNPPTAPRPDKRGGRGKADKDKSTTGKDNTAGKSSTAIKYKPIIKATDPNLQFTGKPFAEYLRQNRFKIEDKEFCFRAVGGTFHGCSPIRGKPCDRLHLNLDCDRSKAAWTKAKLQPVWDFLQKDATKQLVTVTPEFTTFYESLE